MISKAMEKSLSEQLNQELYSAYLYLAMAAYAAHIHFNGAASWFKHQHEEEQMHASKIYNYLIEQDMRVILQEISSPPSEFGNILELFESSLEHKQLMTARLNEVSDESLKEKDHATYNLLQWYVNEQVEEEASISGIISKIKMVNNDGYGLLMIDNELGSQSAPAPIV